MAFLTGGGTGGFGGKRVEAEFVLVCPGAGAACLESILETLVWEGCLRNAPVVGFVVGCLLRSRADICLVTAVTELDIVYGWYRLLGGSSVGKRRARSGSTRSFNPRRVLVTCHCFPRPLIPESRPG